MSTKITLKKTDNTWKQFGDFPVGDFFIFKNGYYQKSSNNLTTDNAIQYTSNISNFHVPKATQFESKSTLVINVKAEIILRTKQ